VKLASQVNQQETKKMAKTKETKETKAPKGKAAEQTMPAVKSKNTAVGKAVDFAALAAKANAAKELDQATRSADGVNVNYISLCQQLTKALDEEEDQLFIPGLKQKDFFIQGKKLILGKSFRAVPLAFLTVYTEYSGPGQSGKFLGLWHKDDALKYPLCIGHFFNRELPSGHELRPAHWVMVYLPDYPEIDKAVITFKSTGNKVAKAWNKDVDARGASCQLVYNVGSHIVTNDRKEKWSEILPEFEGFVYTTDPFKIEEDFAETVINLSLEYNGQYQKGILVPRKEAGTRMAEDAVVDRDDDDDKDAPTF
jgi:hypothetical protein